MLISRTHRRSDLPDVALGSVVGICGTIHHHHGRYAVMLYGEDARRAIPCWIPTELLDTVEAAGGHRVRVLGTVTRQRTGRILRIDVAQWERLPDDADLRSVADLVSLAPGYTGQRSTDAYLRWMRERAAPTAP